MIIFSSIVDVEFLTFHTPLLTSSALTFSQVSLHARKTNYLETTLQLGNTFHLVLFSQYLVSENERAIASL